MAEARAYDPIEIRKVQRFLEKKTSEYCNVCYGHENVYLVADSKGNYLNRERETVAKLIDTSCLTVLSRKGRKTADGIQFLENKISSGGTFSDIGRSIVLFWPVTCDVNNFQLPERWLLPRFNTPAELLSNLKPSLDRLVKIHQENEIDIGVLETPPIFWSQWNRKFNHPDWQSFQDAELHQQIDAVNTYIRDTINPQLNYTSPKFVLDFIETRRRSSNPLPGHRNSLTSCLYSDGVHPLPVVSQKWLYQIMRSVSK